MRFLSVLALAACIEPGIQSVSNNDWMAALLAQRPDCEALGLKGPKNSCAQNARTYKLDSPDRQKRIDALIEYEKRERSKIKLGQPTTEPSLQDEGLSTVLPIFRNGEIADDQLDVLTERLVDFKDAYAFEFKSKCTKGAQLYVQRILAADIFVTSAELEKFQIKSGGTEGAALRSMKKRFTAEYESRLKKATANVLERQLGVDYAEPETKIKKLRVCTPPKLDPVNYIPIAIQKPGCGSNLTENFADNQYRLLDSQLKSDPEFEACIKKEIAEGREIDRVLIESSSSLLDNTDGGRLNGKLIETHPFDAKTQFCEKGFLGLSKARADAVKEQILPMYSALSAVDPSKIVIQSGGSNKDPATLVGDGTSGPCPYEVKADGSVGFKAGYEPGGSKRKDLESAKYVRMNVTFKSSSKPIDSKLTHYYVDSVCHEVKAKCN